MVTQRWRTASGVVVEAGEHVPMAFRCGGLGGEILRVRVVGDLVDGDRRNQCADLVRQHRALCCMV